MAADALVDDLAQLLLADKEADLQIELMAGDGAVNKAQILRDRLVVDQTADGGVDDAVAHLAVDLLAVAHPDGSVQPHSAGSVGGNGAEYRPASIPPFSLGYSPSACNCIWLNTEVCILIYKSLLAK